ncbi:response regulator [Flavisolibacter sp. BT320]|nr:response regulator [Flavisolibacter longurius]
MKRIFLLLCSCVVLASTAFGQPDRLKFTAVTTKEGLSSNTVNVIIKDSYGLVWFGTDDGLNKFDGNTITVYRNKPGDAASLPTNEVLSLHEDRSGNLWVGTSGGSIARYDRRKDLFTTFPAGTGKNKIVNNVIRGICSDVNGNVWIVHYAGVDILKPSNGTVTPFPLQPPSRRNAPVVSGMTIFEDSKNRIWIGTSDGLWQHDVRAKKTTAYFHQPGDSLSLGSYMVNTIAEDSDGAIWIGTDNGLSRIKRGTNTFTTYRQHNSSVPNMRSVDYIYSIAFDKDELCMGTGNGLLIRNRHTGAISQYADGGREKFGLSAFAVRNVYIDPQGTYWLGSFRGGVNKYDRNLNLFEYVQSNAFDRQGLNHPIVTAFAEGEKGKVFVGTEGGLSLFDRQTKLFQTIPLKSKRKDAEIKLSVLSLVMSQHKRLAVGTYADGLFLVDPITKSYRQLLKGTDKGDLNANDIFCMKEDRAGNLWVGTNGEGINVLNAAGEVTVRYTPRPVAANDSLLPLNGYIRDILEDKEGAIWIATHGGGIACLQVETGRFTIYHTLNSKLPNDKIQTLLEDRDGNIWAGTHGGGIAIFQRKTGQFTVLSEKDGLQNNTVRKIVEDPTGRKWISLNTGISSIAPGTQKISNYNYPNGVQRSNFMHGSGLLLSDGDIFFGGLEGFNYFRPSSFTKNNTVPEILFTDLVISNQSVAPSEDGPIGEHISLAKEINLDYKQNFALKFVGLSYTAPEQNQYAYKLEGFDKTWNYVGNTTTAFYTNLDPGVYVFRVKASNNDGVWNEEGASIRIRVHPPFWRTTYAYLLYLLTAASLLLFIRQKGIAKLKRTFALEQEKMRVEQARKEAARIHELDLQKIKFLTNLSHEFRTPISLILGPVDTLLQEAKTEQTAGHLQMIKRNGKRLLNLVNQLLDFRKLEEHELNLQATKGELVSFVNDVCDSFKDMAERKQIEFSFTTSLPSYYTHFDHDKIERILFNLLSNAFKFTMPGGRIALEMDKVCHAEGGLPPAIHLKVSDTGIGIPADKKEKIFEHFYQTDTPASILNQGTGIGLSITREFVQLHGGTITVDSQPNVGTTFHLHLPLVAIKEPVTEKAEPELPSNVDAEPEIEAAQTAEGIVAAAGDEKPLVLIVEDNDDFRYYLKDNLQRHYRVLEAANGKEGWQKALANHPQLVVSDINMPVMDGIELSRKLRADKRTAHIPLILLTALTGEENQLKGLESGASDYVTKPFHVEVLNVKIRNLLQLNNQLKTTYSRQIKVLAPEVSFLSANEKLLQTIAQYLEENLTNSQLSVEELSRHVCMSRSSLYSKLLELTGQTPVEYIRSVKLEKAAVMLEKSDMNIAQIAYSVGFSTPNYFAKSFKAKYGMLPSDYITKKRNEEGKKASNRSNPVA